MSLYCKKSGAATMAFGEGMITYYPRLLFSTHYAVEWDE